MYILAKYAGLEVILPLYGHYGQLWERIPEMNISHDIAGVNDMCWLCSVE